VDQAQKRRHASLIREAERSGKKIVFVAREVLDRASHGVEHQGVLAELEPFHYGDLEDLLESGKKGRRVAVILDGVTDPQNLGAVLRSAGAFGVDFVVVPRDRSASPSPVVSKVAAGGAEAVPVARVTNLARALGRLKGAGFWCYALESGADAFLQDVELAGDVALVLGSEGKGIRRLVKKAADAVVSIRTLGPIPSLNVASAAACGLYEVFRQRQAEEGGKDR